MRFYIDDEHICDSKEVLPRFWIETYPQAKRICDFLNQQEDTIKRKESVEKIVVMTVRRLENQLSWSQRKINKLTRENELLKKQK